MLKYFIHSAWMTVLFPLIAFTQQRERWIALPQEQWPTIALTNHVEFKNGDKYIDPSFAYAGTGFLIDNGIDTFAVTAKHILWVARNKQSSSVQINDALSKWTMKPKDGNSDSAIINQLLNEDSLELLMGAESTILERDVLVFSVKNVTKGIHVLKPRYNNVVAGEKVFIVGNPYSAPTTQVYETRVLRKLGRDILIEQLPGKPVPGISGSPVIDSSGHVIGIFSAASSDGDKDVYVAISSEYLKDVLARKPNFNKPLQDYGTLLLHAVLKKGTASAIAQYEELIREPKNFYVFNLRSSNRNGLRETGEKLIEMKRYNDAVDILRFNVGVNSGYFHHYNLLANAWLLAGNKEEAIRIYEISTTKLDNKNENPAFAELEKLKHR